MNSKFNLIQMSVIFVIILLLSSLALSQTSDPDDVEALSEDEVRIEIDGETIEEEEDSEVESEEGVEKEKEVKLLIKKKGEEEDAGIVRIGDEDIIIREDEMVSGDVVNVGGNISVYGEVQGDVVCIGGVLEVGSEAHITGDVVSVGGELNLEPGAEIEGQRTEVGMRLPFGMKLGKFLKMFHDTLTQRIFNLLKTVGWLIVWLLIGLAMVAFAPEHFNTIKGSYQSEFLITALAGLITAIVVPVASIILFFTIIGIPIVPLLWTVFLVGGFIGLSALASLIAEKVFPRLKEKKYLSTVIGILLLDALLLLGRIIALPGGVFELVGNVISGFGGAIVLVGFVIGLGSIVLTRFGKRARDEVKDEEEVSSED